MCSIPRVPKADKSQAQRHQNAKSFRYHTMTVRNILRWYFFVYRHIHKSTLRPVRAHFISVIRSFYSTEIGLCVCLCVCIICTHFSPFILVVRFYARKRRKKTCPCINFNISFIPFTCTFSPIRTRTHSYRLEYKWLRYKQPNIHCDKYEYTQNININTFFYLISLLCNKFPFI